MSVRAVALQASAADNLYARIGAFLSHHRLSAEPDHYSFAHHVLSEPHGVVAQAVASLSDGGFRLTREDIEQLGGRAAAGHPVAPTDESSDIAAAAVDQALVAETQLQVEGFADTIRTIHDETHSFGRELAASAEAVRQSADLGAIDEIARLTGAMLERVHGAEVRLERATREADELRDKLAEAQGQARRDPLTDLANRRAFEEAFAASDGATQRCVAICDVDHFKRVNDSFGHAVGDRVLRAIAQALGAACGDHLVARYGGEEFAVLFVDVDPATARTALDQARTAVAAKRYRLRESDEPLGAITFSAGLSIARPGEQMGVALGAADRALYRAKQGGRNNVIVAGEPELKLAR